LGERNPLDNRGTRTPRTSKFVGGGNGQIWMGKKEGLEEAPMSVCRRKGPKKTGKKKSYPAPKGTNSTSDLGHRTDWQNQTCGRNRPLKKKKPGRKKKKREINREDTCGTGKCSEKDRGKEEGSTKRQLSAGIKKQKKKKNEQGALSRQLFIGG